MAVESVLIIAIATFAVGFFVGRITASRNGTQTSSPRPQWTGSIPDDLDVRVRSFLDQGRKIEAIKELRHYTSLGLKEAKEIVDGMAAGTHQISTSGSSFSVATGSPASGGDPADSMSRVKQLLRSGKKIEAIKQYREVMGTGLKEAKDAVDRMDSEMR